MFTFLKMAFLYKWNEFLSAQNDLQYWQHSNCWDPKQLSSPVTGFIGLLQLFRLIDGYCSSMFQFHVTPWSALVFTPNYTLFATKFGPDTDIRFVLFIFAYLLQSFYSSHKNVFTHPVWQLHWRFTFKLLTKCTKYS